MFIKLFFTPLYLNGTTLVGWTAQVHNTMTNVWTKMEFDTNEVTRADIKIWQKGALIQTAFARLTRTQREFLISGLTPYEQAKLGMSFD
jgi:hypothetical protein